MEKNINGYPYIQFKAHTPSAQEMLIKSDNFYWQLI